MFKIILIITFVLILLILLIYNLPFINIYYFKINSLLNARNLKEIKNKTELLNYPLCEFMINSSHNTYINSIQHANIITCSGIKFALQAGARCIELDISTYMKNYPIVAHGDSKYITTTYMKLENIIDCILEYGFNTSDPLFIYIEMPELDNENINIIDIDRQEFQEKEENKVFNLALL